MSPIKLLKQEVVDGYKQSKWMPLLTAYAVLSIIIGPGIHLPMFHLPFIAIGLFLSLKNGSKSEMASILFLFYLPLNIIVTQPDTVFQSWSRLALFSVVYLFLSPILSGNYIGDYRRKILIGLLLICVLLGVGSFVCYFLGINYMVNQYDGSAITDFSSAGGFGGLIMQSISLGFVSGLGMLFLLYRALLQDQSCRKWYYFAIVILAVTVLISSSRTALMSALAGGLIMVYQNNKKNGRFVKIIMGILLTGMLTYPIWEGFAAGLQAKNSSNEDLGAYGSRTEKWTARIDEFESSPLFGVGFAAQDPNGNDYFDRTRGTVEPGSSWLCILSMTGIVGFILFINVIRKPYLYLKKHPTPYNSFLLGLMIFICTHMISEGYIYAGGSSLCFIAWLIFGCCNDARYQDYD